VLQRSEVHENILTLYRPLHESLRALLDRPEKTVTLFRTDTAQKPYPWLRNSGRHIQHAKKLITYRPYLRVFFMPFSPQIPADDEIPPLQCVV